MPIPRAEPLLREPIIERLRERGTERDADDGEVLAAAGSDEARMIVVLRGTVAAVVDLGGPDEHVLREFGPGEFLGGSGLLMGHRAFVSAVAQRDARVVEIDLESLRAIMDEDVDLSELFLRVFLARHDRLDERDAGVVLVGARSDAATRRLLETLARNRVPARRIDPGDGEAALHRAGLADGDLPVVLVPGRPPLSDPSDRALLDALGMTTRRATSTGECDALVVGAGPGGLSAAVYAASEGLSTVLAEETAFGGQAGTSSRIENYLGFPAGLSGEELAVRALLQLEKFGVDRRLVVRATGLQDDGDRHRVTFDDGSTVSARALIVATGAEYNRLALERISDFEDAGVYYAATVPEAHACAGRDVVVVGGGNSAGQAALYLARRCTRVELVIRGPALQASMSQYLIDQIEHAAGIVVRPRTDVTAVDGGDRLDEVQLADRATGEHERRAVGGLFVFIGATPCTGWLDGRLQTDEDGFLLTGDAVTDDRDARDIFECSRRNIFCIGDARSGSVKRVAAAIGEGATAVRVITARFAEAG